MESSSISSGKKSRHAKEDSHHSSKKRKRRDDLTSDVVPQDGEKKKKKKKEHKHRDDTANEQQNGLKTSSASKKNPQTNSTTSKSDAPAGASDNSSPFHSITSTLYLPLSPVSISHTQATPSLLAEHISPLLLTYYPPVRGIILAYSNPSISSKPPVSTTSPERQRSKPQPLTLALTANEYGVLYVYLTLTFLVFRPEQSQSLEGWVNVQSEDFLGAIVYNLFSVGIERGRLPRDWKWVTPGESQTESAGQDGEPEPGSDKENSTLPIDAPGADASALAFDDEYSASTGYFQTGSGKRIRGTINFQIHDVDVIPGSERDKGFLSLEGTMLNPEKEANLVYREKIY